MLGKFREKYPNAGLISELVKIDRHLYIVKVSVVVDGITLSSGLASAETIEMAEDKARIRAIDGLQLDAIDRPLKSEVLPSKKSGTELKPQARETFSNGVTVPTTVNGKRNKNKEAHRLRRGFLGVKPEQEDVSNTLDTSSAKMPNISQIHRNETKNSIKEFNSDVKLESNDKESFKLDSTPEDKPLPIPDSLTPVDKPLPIPEPPTPVESTPTQGSLFKTVSSSSPFSKESEEFIPIENIPVEEIPDPEETDAVDHSYYSQSHAQAAKTESTKPATADSSTSKTKPKKKQDEDGTIVLEYNDVIDETNIHIKRIRWSKEQGRNYLIETYGKRSRHSLTEQQLFEFLQFLRAQPDPEI